MLSERRSAQLGLLSACTLLITTLTILYQGSRQTAGGPGAINESTASVTTVAHHDADTARLAAAVMGK